MARVQPRDGKYELRGSKDTDLEGIDDKKYNVFTDEEKLANAKRDYPDYNWFVSYTIKDKDGNDVRDLPEYTIRFDKPDVETFEMYYYLNGTVHPFQHENASDKATKKRVKAKLKIGDPPVGHYP